MTARSQVLQRVIESYQGNECIGIAVEILDFVLRKAGIAYVRVPLNISGVYGALANNGSWTGYLGAIQQMRTRLH